ncbi:MAG TPA: TolC family protein [Bryobacteraceae bacterium]|nr:TolC family protein [Bryobacteraceae bacterium]
MNLRIPILLALTSCALAQDNSPLKLTLRDAVTLALKQNPQVILANLGVVQSDQDRKVARSALLPQINGSLAEAVHRVNLEASIGFSFPGFAQHIGPYYVAQGGVNFDAPVFDLTLWRRYRSSQIGVDSSRAQEMSVREESVLLVVSQYLGSQRADADVRAAQSRVELAQALYDQSADLQKNGVGTGIDTLRANVQLQNEKQRLIVARTQRETSLYGLARLLNIDPRRAIELADNVSFFETPAVSPDQTLERAYSARPELRQILSEEQRAGLEKKSAGEQRLPKLSLSGVWLEQGITPASAIPVYTYQASLDFPMFTGGRIAAQQTQAEVAIRQLKQQEQDLRNRIALEVKTAVAQLESARNEVTVANLGVDLARQEVVQARDRFQAGVANNIEVITAQDELARANDNQIAALYRYNQSRADLAHAVGQMETLYAK